ncbi:maltokinase N-terminal cap-like domain-containing protein [Streptomyces fuscigenes]|uniref:maltokinase N-terminal cap-like domain-containing protein n=1 Tax=Streptomyces fuscigenes TaxID=1528880 RepID=UPI001F32C35E|nr:phosphotransferase [Streptomyces fuscigenes]MCF3961941.1 phosphotransferase [Streptomyces fuscigenes]
MPKAASTRSTARPAGVRTLTPSAAAAATVDSLAPLLREWLPRQRWFAGKGRSLTALVPVSVTELLPPVPSGGEGPGLLHLLLRVEQHDTGRPSAAPGGGDCYQLLLGVRTSLPPHLGPALVGRAAQGPLAGRTVYDAVHDPYLAGVLMDRLRSVEQVGPLRFGRADRIPAALAPRLLDAEQSNTSLVYGDAYILKILRRVVPGPHPDLELPLALAAEGCARVPAPVAWFEAADPAGSGEQLTLGVLQPYLRGSTDGWQLALAALSGGRDFVPEARELGRATAEVHLALASALPTVVLDAARTAQLAEAMNRRLDTAAQAVPALMPHAPGLRAAFDALGRLGTRTRPAQRVHGDLHLGQTLRSPDGSWSVIDFEGEPARPLAERRRPQPPVRDVAGMLRSFDYAARSHEPWRGDWAARCRDAYCEGYAQAAGTDPRDEPELLRAYETDKAIYEVLYEARHRPDWLPVPMAAIERLAAGR